MTDETGNLVLEHLRYMRGRIDCIADDVIDVKPRMSSVEGSVARLTVELGHLRGDIAGVQVRIDKVDTRLGRIERRLDLADSTP